MKNNSVLERKIKKLMAKKLAECKVKNDYIILLDGQIISTTRHTQGNLNVLIR